MRWHRSDGAGPEHAAASGSGIDAKAGASSSGCNGASVDDAAAASSRWRGSYMSCSRGQCRRQQQRSPGWHQGCSGDQCHQLLSRKPLSRQATREVGCRLRNSAAPATSVAQQKRQLSPLDPTGEPKPRQRVLGDFYATLPALNPVLLPPSDGDSVALLQRSGAPTDPGSVVAPPSTISGRRKARGYC